MYQKPYHQLQACTLLYTVWHEAAAVQQRRCPQQSYSPAVSAAVLLKKNKIKSSTEKQSSAIIVHEAKRTATSPRTTHTRQNNPYWLGAAPAGVVGARGRCFPAATVPEAVVFPYGVCCCIAENIQNKVINRKTELCHHRPRSKAHSNEYENNAHKAEQSLPAWRGAGRSSRGTKPLLSSSDGARSCRIRLRCPLLYC